MEDSKNLRPQDSGKQQEQEEGTSVDPGKDERREQEVDCPDKSRFFFQYPSRGRPGWFKETFTAYLENLSGEHHYRFQVAIDTDDATMNNADMLEWIGDRASVVIGNHQSKIEACNSALPDPGNFDVVVLISDDMVPFKHGFDDVIHKDFKRYCPDYDGVMRYWDRMRLINEHLVTWTVMGREFFKYYGCLYHPNYRSQWCDNELTDVALRENKLFHSTAEIVEHQWKKFGMDLTYSVSDEDFGRDREVYEQRKEKGFPLYEPGD
jgi:hypothetical protein